MVSSYLKTIMPSANSNINSKLYDNIGFLTAINGPMFDRAIILVNARHKQHRQYIDNFCIVLSILLYVQNYSNHKYLEELRTMTPADLDARLTEAKKELFNLRFQNATNQLENTGRIKEVRKNIARIQTIITEKANA